MHERQKQGRVYRMVRWREKSYRNPHDCSIHRLKFKRRRFLLEKDQVDVSGRMDKIDVHGKKLREASIYICNRVEEAFVVGFQGLTIIHGYKRGTVIRDYIRKGRLRRNLKLHHPKVPLLKLNRSDPGVTHVIFAEQNN
jgi:hypothetical protein